MTQAEPSQRGDGDRIVHEQPGFPADLHHPMPQDGREGDHLQGRVGEPVYKIPRLREPAHEGGMTLQPSEGTMGDLGVPSRGFTDNQPVGDFPQDGGRGHPRDQPGFESGKQASATGPLASEVVQENVGVQKQPSAIGEGVQVHLGIPDAQGGVFNDALDQTRRELEDAAGGIGPRGGAQEHTDGLPPSQGEFLVGDESPASLVRQRDRFDRHPNASSLATVPPAPEPVKPSVVSSMVPAVDLVRQDSSGTETPADAPLLAMATGVSGTNQQQGEPSPISPTSTSLGQQVPIYHVMNVLGLHDLSSVELISERQIEGAVIKRIRLPRRTDITSPPLGLETLQHELSDALDPHLTTFDVVYNAHGAVIAVFPMPPPNSSSPWMHYFDWSHYCFAVPAISDPAAQRKWEAGRQEAAKAQGIILAYQKESPYAYRAVGDVMGSTYAYLELGETGHSYRAIGFNPYQLARNIPPYDATKHQAIIPIFPTVYAPDWYDVHDRLYLKALYGDRGGITAASDVLVVGPGSGVDSWIVSLRTRRPIYAIGVNPFEVANLHATAALAEFAVHAIVADNLIAEDGTPRFPGKQFDRIVWGAPFPWLDVDAANDPRPVRRGSDYWDGVPVSVWIRLARGLHSTLRRPDGRSILWAHSPAYQFTPQEQATLTSLFQSAGAFDKKVRFLVEEFEPGIYLLRFPTVDSGSEGATLWNAVQAWAPLVGGKEQVQRLMSFSEEQERRLKDASQPMVMLVELTQLTEDPLLSLLLEAIRQKGYFAAQGGAVQLVLVDEAAESQAQAEQRTDTILANINIAHKGATQLSRALASAVLAGTAASEAIAQIAPPINGVPTPVIRVPRALAPSPEPSAQSLEGRQTHATVFAPALLAALDIASVSLAERAGIAAAVKERYGVTAVKSDDPLVPVRFLPVVVPVPSDELGARLRAFRLAAGSN